ncbi:MAG: elongation factor 1-beta [Candidatus Nezhaarchaeales archaeon]
MAKVAALIKVLPTEAEANLEELRKEIERRLPGYVKLQKADVEEVAFGIRALKLLVLLPEEEGVMSEVEEAVSKAPGVSQVDVEFVTRV